MVESHDYQEIIQQEYRELVRASGLHSDEELEMVDRAFEFADSAHKGVVRKSGEPYILHPVAVARIATELVPHDAEAICAALLHDVVEDTPYTVEELREMFNANIANIVDGLTKIDELDGSDASKQEINYQKLLLTIDDDFRIIFIKLADRLHNMRTLGAMPEHKRDKIASETTYFYSPIAERVGLYNVKIELENLSLKAKYPKAYKAIADELQQISEGLNDRISHFALPFEEQLTHLGIEHTLQRRQKSIYSIWKKMEKKNIPFSEVYDLLAMRIVFTPVQDIPESTQCWFIYSLLANLYTVQQDRTRDWVTKPKANGYEALHCTLLSKQGEWIEVQIRTVRMDSIAEYGLASHWRYKHEGGNDAIASFREGVANELSKSRRATSTFVNQIQSSILRQQIAFTDSSGRRHKVPRGSTVLDCAYALSRAIGNTALGATVDGVLMNLDHEIRGGEVVHIISANSQLPSRKWLDYVRTPLAKNCIAQAVRDYREQQTAVGRRRVLTMVEAMEVNFSESDLLPLLPYFSISSENLGDLYIAIADGSINLARLRKKLQRKYFYYPLSIRRSPSRKLLPRQLPFVGQPSSQASDEQLEYEQSPCCFALPGDVVTGFQLDEEVVVVHRKICPEGERLSAQRGEKIVKVHWESSEERFYTAHFYLTGDDRKALLADLFASVINERNPVNITNVNMQSDGNQFQGVISVSVRNRKELESIIHTVNSLVGIRRVYRVDSPSSFSGW
ncbi:MAG: GTP pyrophosphokinase [Bacteroidetes bacterium]|nr:MAG: GTP pyrophosphokinase [Bacteroidota bacterium]